MDTMVGGRALTDAGCGEGARTTRLADCEAAAVAIDAWHGANGPGSTVHRALTEGQRGPRLNGIGPPLKVIERIDHGSVSSAEILELLLSFSKSGGAGLITRELIDRFGSLGAVLAAQPSRLAGWLEGDQVSVFLLKIVRVAVRMTLREPLEAGR